MGRLRELRWAATAAAGALVALTAAVGLWILFVGQQASTRASERDSTTAADPGAGVPGWTDRGASAEDGSVIRDRAGNGMVLYTFDAPYEVVWSGPATCTGAGQVCDVAASIDFDVPSRQRLSIKVEAPQVHCSSVRYRLSLNDGPEVLTSFMRFNGAAGRFAQLPTNEVVDLGVVPAGTHTLKAVSEGQISGCNSGEFRSASLFLDFPEGIEAEPAVFVPAG